MKPAAPKNRIERLTLTHIADSLRLFEEGIRLAPASFPCEANEPIEDVRSNYFNFMASAGFIGFIMKRGRRPIAQICGCVHTRSIGTPRVYCTIANFWCTPSERGKGNMKLMWNEFITELRRAGISAWEANTCEAVTAYLTKTGGRVHVKKLFERVGGNI
jgi:hypothetical protein